MSNILTVTFTILRAVILTCLMVSLVSCSSITQKDINRVKDVIDPDIGLTREDYREKWMPQKTEQDFRKEDAKTSKEPSIPDISEILTSPSQPEIAAIPDKLISLSVTDDVPLKDVLIELSRLADVDMEIDPNISGGIIFRVKDKPFNKVVERVAELGGLRYFVKDDVIRVERDMPYLVDYSVDFLNVTRTSSSSINIDTQGLGGDESDLPSGSTSSIDSASAGDIWESVGQAVTNILQFTQSTNLGTAAVDPGSQIPDAQNATGGSSSTSLQINRPSGVISVIATTKQHKTISEYLKRVMKQLSAQVLIEAKIVEVTLDEEYRSGVDWGELRSQNLGLKIAGNFTGGIGSNADFFTIGGDSGKNLSTAVSLTEQFGVSRTLSSPRLHAMHNQQAVLSFAENFVYFDLQVQEETDDTDAGTNTKLTVESELQTVPVGIILSLQPSINLENNEITMHIRPTLSRVTDRVSDPGVDIIVARQDGPNPVDITSEIPVIEVRELDSVLKVTSGNIMVIGGLMKDVESSEDKGVPGLNRVPVLGNLFKSKVQTSEVVETIIFIKATIINDSKVSEPDKRIYRTFAPRDSHPLAF